MVRTHKAHPRRRRGRDDGDHVQQHRRRRPGRVARGLARRRGRRRPGRPDRLCRARPGARRGPALHRARGSRCRPSGSLGEGDNFAGRRWPASRRPPASTSRSPRSRPASTRRSPTCRSTAAPRPTSSSSRSRRRSSQYGAQGLILDIATLIGDTEKLARRASGDAAALHREGGEHLGASRTRSTSSRSSGTRSRRSRPRATRSRRRGTSSSPSPTRSSPTAAARGASAWKPPRRPAGSATDWIEDVLLRTAPAGGVQRSGSATSCRSTRPRSRTPSTSSARSTSPPDYVLGGSTAILATSQTDADGPDVRRRPPLSAPSLLDAEAGRPGTAPTSSPTRRRPASPSQFVVGEDVGLFYFPPIDPEFGNPAWVPATR